MQKYNPSVVLSSDDILNTTLGCEPLGIQYQVTTASSFLAPDKTTRVLRRDSQSGEFVLIAEWVRHTLRPDVFKFTGHGSTAPSEVSVSKFLVQRSGLSVLERSFVGDDGRRYSWSVKTSQLEAYVFEDGKKGAPIAEFHRRKFFDQEQNAYIELFPGYEGTMDSLVVTFLYAEWKRSQSNSDRLQQNNQIGLQTGLGALSNAGASIGAGGF